MYIDFASDWPAYFFMAIFLAFIVYVIVKGHSKGIEDDAVAEKAQEIKKKK
jgi:SNF family Na+-dependent transporter